MDSQLAQLAIVFLLFSVALNLYLTFSIINILKRIPIPSLTEEPLASGDIISNFEGHAYYDNSVFEFRFDVDQPRVFLFLYSSCEKCRSKIPELERLANMTPNAGVHLYLISNESQRKFKQLVQKEALIKISIHVDSEDYDRLNPVGASPYYIFVDEQGVVQAGGLIGDNNWVAFVEQITDLQKVNVA
jgi:thiol-disulfide isomerase/thioredoxin